MTMSYMKNLTYIVFSFEHANARGAQCPLSSIYKYSTGRRHGDGDLRVKSGQC